MTKETPEPEGGTPAGATIAEDPLLGTVLGGRFRVDALLGEGGMGTVYRGTQLSVERSVAIKVILPLLARETEVVERFKREARVTSQISHPHSVHLVDFGSTDDGRLYLVMELLEGQELSDALKARGPLPERRALRITQQVLKALAEAHALDVVHRDLKPANIFLCNVTGEDDFAKVMDFGIASALGAADTKQLTMTGTLVGTPAYMSPEQAQGQAVGPASDLYSLGVILYEMLTGRGPFEADTAMSLMLMHVSHPPPPLEDTAPGLGPRRGLQGLLDRLLAKRAEERFESADAARAAVEDLLEGREPAALPLPATGSAGPSTARLAPGGRRRAAMWGAAALALLGVGGALLSGEDKPPVAAPSPPIVAEPAPTQAPAGEPEAAPEGTEPASEGAERAPAAPDPAPERARKPRKRKRVATRPKKPRARPPKPEEPPPPRDLAAPGETTREPSSGLLDQAAAALNVGDRKGRRQAMLRQGAPYESVREAKTALRAGRIDRAQYNDVIWVLKTQRKRQIIKLKKDYRAGRISRREYKRAVATIDRDYKG